MRKHQLAATVLATLAAGIAVSHAMQRDTETLLQSEPVSVVEPALYRFYDPGTTLATSAQLIEGEVFIEAVIFGPSTVAIQLNNSEGLPFITGPESKFRNTPNTVYAETTRVDLGIVVDGVRYFSPGGGSASNVTIIYRPTTTSTARADLTTTNTNPGDPGYGVPDGKIDGADLSFYVERWLEGEYQMSMTEQATAGIC